MVIYIANYMNMEREEKEHWRYDFPGGLIDDIYYIMMLDLLMPILTYYINLWYYWYHLRIRGKIRNNGAKNMTQQQGNKAF